MRPKSGHITRRRRAFGASTAYLAATCLTVTCLLVACTSVPTPPSRSSTTTTLSVAPVTSHAPSVATVPTVANGRAVLERVDIPATDGFAPRQAYLYLPPATFAHSGRRLPVLELLHGTPGRPADWITLGGLSTTLGAFASTHHGEAPIVVMPDLNGARRADSQCIRTATGQNTESYLTVDVVKWVRRHYGRSVGRERWWVAGLSEGGVCAAMLALRHPNLYSAFGDFSGLAAPFVEHLTHLQSDRQLYGSSLQNKLDHEPLWLLAHHSYVGLPAWFECGASDRRVLPQQALAVAAARAGHLLVHAETVPGRHGWVVWSAALRSLLPWLWRHR